ncbi:hypothetical protein SCLCIDRAFT_863850 [Scleroderma citrinum Foug A]|uniref:Uncharacterized protein n=1 Tax=Scleroderma citrinum Foug A TaxID=1036808 RepID=A0A0C3DM15_9AGAM|nr:hypothetical protein SCLCIDRAFT_863850 [Scleroderma citrinum Foug A]
MCLRLAIGNTKQTTPVHCPTRLHQYNRVPMCVQCTGNVRAQSASRFAVPENPVLRRPKVDPYSRIKWQPLIQYYIDPAIADLSPISNEA